MNTLDIIKKSSEAVEDQLQCNGFISKHWGDIYQNLVDIYNKVAANQKEGREILFIAETLPIMSGIVHVGSSLKNFQKASKWVSGMIPDTDPAAILSALTFIYIVNQCKTNPPTESDKNPEIWERIYNWVITVLEIQGDQSTTMQGTHPES